MAKRMILEGTDRQIQTVKDLLSFTDNDVPTEVLAFDSPETFQEQINAMTLENRKQLFSVLIKSESFVEYLVDCL